MNASELTSNKITDLINSLESFIRALKSAEQEKKQMANDHRSVAQTVDQRATAEISRVSRDVSDGSSRVDAAIKAVESEYRKLKEEKLREAERFEAEMQDIGQRIKETEDLLRQLKKHEQGLRDYENKALTWYEKANQIMRQAGVTI